MSGRRSSREDGRPAGTSGGKRELVERLPPRDLARRRAQQQAQRVLGLLDVALGAGDLGGGGVEELLGLVDVQARGGAPVVAQLDQLQIVLGDVAVCRAISSSRSRSRSVK